MDETAKEVIIWSARIFGHVYLWGSFLVGFMTWSYDMAFFRTSIMGLVLIGVGNYLSHKWDKQ